MSRLWNCHHCPHLLLSVPLPPENTPSKHPPEQMGQTPVSPSLLACPLSFFRTCLSRGPQARALPFTRGVLEVAAGALQRGHMLKAPCATFWQPKRVKGWAQSYRGKTRVANGQGEGRRKTVSDARDYLPTGLGAPCLSRCLQVLRGAAGTSSAEPEEEQACRNHADTGQFGLDEILKLILFQASRTMGRNTSYKTK